VSTNVPASSILEVGEALVLVGAPAQLVVVLLLLGASHERVAARFAPGLRCGRWPLS